MSEGERTLFEKDSTIREQERISVGETTFAFHIRSDCIPYRSVWKRRSHRNGIEPSRGTSDEGT